MINYNESITHDELAELPLGRFNGNIHIIDSNDKVNKACDFLLKEPVIGFDTETRPSFQAGKTNKVALLQLSTANDCFLFRLNKMRLDKAILKILENKDIVKVGADVKNDITALASLRHFKASGFIDLQQYSSDWGIKDKSLRKLSAIILGQRISKAQRLSNWESAKLTEPQKLYAATDAWVCREIYLRLSQDREKKERNPK